MTRDFSSDSTLIYKVIYPAVWAAGAGSAAVMLFRHPDEVRYNGVMGAAPSWFAYFWAALAVGGTTFILWYFGRFKYVGIENGALLVSNYWTDWRIPLSLIDDAKQTRFVDPMHITITFREDVGCGRRVLFMPKQPMRFSVSAMGSTFSSTQPTTQLAEFRQAVGLPPLP